MKKVFHNKIKDLEENTNKINRIKDKGKNKKNTTNQKITISIAKSNNITKIKTIEIENGKIDKKKNIKDKSNEKNRNKNKEAKIIKDKNKEINNIKTNKDILNIKN